MKEEITVEQTQELYDYLLGKPQPDNFRMKHLPKLSDKKAFQIILFIQEHLRIIPDHYEQCYNCKSIFDTYSDGLYWETKGRHYCGVCSDLVPYNYDKGKK